MQLTQKTISIKRFLTQLIELLDDSWRWILLFTVSVNKLRSLLRIGSVSNQH